MSYSGQVAAITGAGNGIGRALAILLAERGCDLALADRDTKSLAETRELLASTKVKVIVTELDVAKRADVFAWAERVKRGFGKCTMIFNNAGIAYSSTAIDGDFTYFERVMAVNFWGVVHGSQAFVPIIEASGGGSVVNLSSLFGLVAFPGNAAYCSSKFAVRAYTETLRMELRMMKSSVSATCVHPGGIKTGIARAATMDESVDKLGISRVEGLAEMEKLLKMPPRRAAEIILDGVRKKKARVLIGHEAKLMDLLQRFLPGTYGRPLGIGVQINQRQARKSLSAQRT